MEKSPVLGLPPFALAHPSESAATIRCSAVVAALELVRTAMLASGRPPAEHVDDLASFVEAIEKALTGKGTGLS